MKREIKFRMYRDGKMQEVHQLNAYGDVGSYQFNSPEDNGEFIMQSTGLHDKNGKEIYEGDIVQFIHEYKYRTWNSAGENKSLETTEPEINKGIEHVKYTNGSFRIGCVCNDLSMLPSFTEHGENHNGKWTDKYYDFEVIGNIHQNPELIQ